MLFRALTAAVALTALAAAGPALGESAAAKFLKRSITIPPSAAPADDASPATIGLRGPLDAPRPSNLRAPPSPALLPPAPPVSALAAPDDLVATTLVKPAAISPLRATSDPAPICRATCAETRYVCATTDDSECDSKWSQCVAACSTPA